jgi:signal transduction histidine kinase
MELSLEQLELGAVVEGVCLLLQGVSDGRGIEIEVTLAPDLPRVRADAMRLKQILFNLVSNAIKFSPDGSQVTLTASCLPAAESPLGVDSIRVDVVDRGIGIASEDQPLVFQEFRQLDGGGDRRYEGTGLGLALVKRLLELHGGSVEVDSKPGEGSVFRAFLPVDGPPVGDRRPLPGDPSRDDSA